VSELDVLNTEAVARLIGVKPATVISYRAESKPGGRYASHPFPKPDGTFGGRPFWAPERAEEIIEWKRTRRGPGWPKGRSRRTPS
jgi:hypothetical protein